ncbi:MAG: hypothetical protein LLF94_03230 [Chlamydiales bacterium]|nr:hypothetical protein [Chlamydiales bacterium]
MNFNVYVSKLVVLFSIHYNQILYWYWYLVCRRYTLLLAHQCSHEVANCGTP